MTLPGSPATNGMIASIRAKLDAIEDLNVNGSTSADANKALNILNEIETPLAQLRHHLGNGKDFVDGD